jgi:C1A family cysteine protease
MNWFSAFVLLLVVCVNALPSRTDAESAFAVWRDEFRVEFRTIPEYLHRFRIFEQNHVRMWVHNTFDNRTFTVGHNQFSHLTTEEFLEGFGVAPPLHTDYHRIAPVQSHVMPDTIDWVAKGGVTPVKDQGQCGSCWSFSATGALEGAYFVKHGILVSLSEQQLVDCDGTSSGCGGGLMDNAFRYVQHHPLATEAEYPYKGIQGVCHTTGSDTPTLEVHSLVDLPAGNEDALAAAVAAQPVSVAIQANEFAFQFYKAGVLTAACGKQLDHGVLLVGYGVEAGVPYWKIKNSWGPKWGESGYIRIERGTNKCGVAESASFPVLAI